MNLTDTNTTYYLKLTDTLGRITYDSVLVGVHICTGYEELSFKEKIFIIHPNPAKESMQIRYIGNIPDLNQFQLQIINLDGKILLETQLKNAQTLNISTLQPGIYFLHIITEEGSVQVEKLLIL